MKYLNRSIILISALILLSCGTDSEPFNLTGKWQSEGLTSDHIMTLDVSENTIFAAGKNSIFKKDFSSASGDWTDISFEINTENLEVGDVLFTDAGLYAVVRNTTDYHDLPEDYTTLYKSLDFGNNWESVQITLEGRTKPYVINRLAKTDNTLYADWHIIFKSVDGGKTWANLIPDKKVGVSEFLYVSKEHPHQIWTGGWTHIFTPYLNKSEDGGDTWTALSNNVFFSVDATTYAVVIHPQQEDVVLAGFGGAVVSANVIRKSEDGGESWETKLEGFNIRTLQNSKLQQGRVFASGMSPNGTLFFATSNDFGDSWEVVEFEDGPTQIQVNNMISVLQNGREVLYFATNKGVYSYTFSD